MKWKGKRQSANIEDIRHKAPPKAKFGLGGCLVAIVVIFLALCCGINPLKILHGGAAEKNEPTTKAKTTPARAPEIDVPAKDRDRSEDELRQFVAVVLADTEDAWNQEFKELGKTYREPKLVIFRRAVKSGCGRASKSIGPFYCPLDKKAYVDLDFFDTLEEKLDAPGDFAQAYVIAHEVGHHVQNLLGQSSKSRRAKRGKSKKEKNEITVRHELQADCYAGIWAHHAKKMLEDGDIDEGLNAAAKIGDDNLQMEAKGYVVPESFTHGTSRQRMKWFKRGFKSGDMERCDTFSAKSL
jgi:predicted metalloprotease